MGNDRNDGPHQWVEPPAAIVRTAVGAVIRDLALTHGRGITHDQRRSDRRLRAMVE